MSNIGDLVNLAYAAAVRQMYPGAKINFSGEKLKTGIAGVPTDRLLNAALALNFRGHIELASTLLQDIIEKRQNICRYAHAHSWLLAEYAVHLLNSIDPGNYDLKMEERGLKLLRKAVRVDPQNMEARLSLLFEYCNCEYTERARQLADESMKVAFGLGNAYMVREIEALVNDYEIRTA